MTTGPVVAPPGTTTTICVSLQLVAVPALTPLNVTALVPCVAPKLEPLTVTDMPINPDAGVRVSVAGATARLYRRRMPSFCTTRLPSGGAKLRDSPTTYRSVPSVATPFAKSSITPPYRLVDNVTPVAGSISRMTASAPPAPWLMVYPTANIREIDPATGVTLSTSLYGGVMDDFAN